MKKIIFVFMTLLFLGVLAIPAVANNTPLPSSQTLGQMIEKSEKQNQFWTTYAERIRNGVLLGVIPAPFVLALLLVLVISIASISQTEDRWRNMSIAISSGVIVYLIALFVEPIALVVVVCGIVWLIVFGVWSFQQHRLTVQAEARDRIPD